MVARDDIVCRRAMWSLNTTGTGTWTGRGGECIIGEHGEYISEDIGVFHHLRHFIGLLIHDGQVVYRSFRCHIVICNVYGVIWRVYSVYSIVRLQVVVWSVYRIVITHKQPYRCEECFKMHWVCTDATPVTGQSVIGRRNMSTTFGASDDEGRKHGAGAASERARASRC